MTVKAVIGAMVLAVGVGVGAYGYYAPILAMQGMQAAAEQRDADTFNQYVDYPQLRESLKGQLAGMMATQLGGSGTGTDSVGLVWGMALINPLVDALVRPELVMRAMQSGDWSAKPSGSADAPKAGTSDDVVWQIERDGISRVTAYAMARGETDTAQAVGMVFVRHGLFDWKLTELRLPAGFVQ